MKWIKKLFGIRTGKEVTQYRPKRNKSQNQLVLDHLMKYRTITPDEAWFNYEVKNLSARVSQLRKSGVGIDYVNGVYRVS